MANEFWLSDQAWSAIEPLLPKNQPGARRVDDRRVISGIVRSCILLPSSRTQFCAERDLIQLASPQPPQVVQGAGRVGEQV